jgi:aerobic-type carbon monoxide dehydrogenase small subunit (CoxS/CutS family)
MQDQISDQNDAQTESEGVLRARLSRRNFIQTLGASAAAATVASGAKALASQPVVPPVPMTTISGPGPIDLALMVNGSLRPMRVEPSTTLLEALRMNVGLTGAKEICDRGSCGGCSVLIEGKLVVSCMMLAIDAVGAKITTIEGLSQSGKLDPIQEMFIKHDALQCGYCTPGLVMASKWLLSTNPNPTLNQIKHALSGNICRCGTYTNIFNAVLEASGQKPLMDAALPA